MKSSAVHTWDILEAFFEDALEGLPVKIIISDHGIPGRYKDELFVVRVSVAINIATCGFVRAGIDCFARSDMSSNPQIILFAVDATQTIIPLNLSDPELGDRIRNHVEKCTR